MTAHTPRVCQYKGTAHLCFFTGEQHQGFARGHGVIMDQHYRVVKQVDSSGAGASRYVSYLQPINETSDLTVVAICMSSK